MAYATPNGSSLAYNELFSDKRFLLGVSPITAYLFPVLLAAGALAALQLGAADGIAACGASANCPQWTPIMTSQRPSTFFSYYENHSDEFLGVPLRSAYQFPSATEGCGPAGNCLPSCTFPDRFPWFVDATGSDATDSHPYRNPSSGNVSSYPEEGVRGFEFIGSFEGAVTNFAPEVIRQALDRVRKAKSLRTNRTALFRFLLTKLS